jgi:hypothetical protein
MTTNCCCNSYHHPETEIWDDKSSPLQSRPHSIPRSCVWHAWGSIARMKISQKWWGEGSDAFLASTTSKKHFFFLLGYRSLLKDVKGALQRVVTAYKNKSACEEKTRRLVWNDLQPETQLLELSADNSGGYDGEDLSMVSWRISCWRSCCQEMASGDCNRLRTLVSVSVVCKV